MNRAQKRANEVAESYLDSLITLLVNYKNEHSTTADGHATVERNVHQYRLILEMQWKAFCDRNNNIRNRVSTFRLEAFRERYENAMTNHNRLAWFSAVRDLCIERYGFEPPYHLILESFKMYSDPNDGAIHCFNYIKANEPNLEFKFSPFI
jgi:hypothetical protein